MKIGRWTKEEDDILKQYYGKISSNDISFKLSRTRKSVLDRANRLGIKAFNYRPDIVDTTNHDFFSIPNIENSYWAGLIAADGYIYKNRVSIELTKDDSYLLDRFKENINYFGNIHERKSTRKDSCNRKSSRILTINSKKIVSDLKLNWNIIPKKSKVLAAPNNNNGCLDNYLSYLRGYIDGDGHITIIKNKYLQIGWCGNKAFVEWTRDLINFNLGIDSNIHYHCKSYKHCRIEYFGKKAIELSNYLTNVETPAKLFRKWDKINVSTK